MNNTSNEIRDRFCTIPDNAENLEREQFILKFWPSFIIKVYLERLAPVMGLKILAFVDEVRSLAAASRDGIPPVIRKEIKTTYILARIYFKLLARTYGEKRISDL